MSREQALTMIIASIAMEERALGYIIEAEGDKLRHVLDKCGCGVTPQEVLKVNKSVTELLEAASENQSMLRCKLALALDAGGECPPAPPCPPPEPPCPPKPKPPCEPPRPFQGQKSFMKLVLPGECFLWKNDCLIPWERALGRGGAIHWSREEPALVRLDSGRAYSLSCTFFLPTAASGEICLEGAGTARKALPLCFPVPCTGIENAMLQYSTLLLPGGPAAVSFRLHSKIAFLVKGAELNIVEL